MAVVFISPKQRQKTFFVGITIVVVLFLIIISLGVFSAKPKEISSALVFNRPKVDIDMRVFDSDQFKNLAPFAQMQIQYSYKATAKDNKPQNGFITADSVEQAQLILKAQGLVVIEIKEAQIGRDNPFIPYYQVAPTPVPKTQTITPKK